MKHDFRVLIIRNRLKVDVSDDIAMTKQYEESRTPLRLSFGYEDTDFDLEHTSFGVKNMIDNEQVEMFGLKGVKEKIRKLGIVPRFGIFHAVVFLYDLEDTGWYEKHAPHGHRVGHWTYFKEIYPGTEFIEIATSEGWDAVNDVYRVLTHELRHAYVFRARRNGIALKDPMDLTPVSVRCSDRQPDKAGKCLENIPYYKEFEVEAVDGNRAKANAVLSPHWAKVVDSPQTTVLAILLKTTTQMIEQAIKIIVDFYETKEEKEKKEEHKSRMEDWALAIKEFEGWFVGSRSYRNHNPGNLRYSKYQLGLDSGGYAIFKDYETGWKALLFQLEIAVDGRSNVYKPSDTLLEFFSKYAPSSDNNHPETYAKFVANKLGVDLNTEIRLLA